MESTFWHVLALPFLHLLSITVITSVVLWLFKRLTNARKSRGSNYPPGSTGLPLVGETLAFLAANNSSKGFYDFVQRRHLRYGPCFKTNIFGQTHVFISSTEVAKALLSSDSVDFSKRYIRTVAELLGNESLLCSSHEHHRFIRRNIASLFTLDSSTSFMTMFDKLTTELMQKWAQKKRVIVLDDALTITFKAIFKMLISTEDEGRIEKLQHDVFEITEAMLAFPLRLPGTRFYRGLQARKRIMSTLREEITMRRKGLQHHKDFLQHLLLKGQCAIDEALTDEQILDNILTLIIAGQVTTATAITWMVKYLDDNEAFQETLRATQLELASKDCSSPLRLEDLSRMEHAYKAVKESLRMATIVSWFPRVALKDGQIGGFDILKGWIVNIDARSIHYDSMSYDDPMTFDPSRFNFGVFWVHFYTTRCDHTRDHADGNILDGRKQDLKPYSFLVFGAGARICLGMNLAKIMMLIFLHRLVTTFRWKIADRDSSLEKWAMFPRLKNGCPIHLIPIENPEARM